MGHGLKQMSTEKKEVFTARFARGAEDAERIVFCLTGDAVRQKASAASGTNCINP